MSTQKDFNDCQTFEGEFKFQTRIPKFFRAPKSIIWNAYLDSSKRDEVSNELEP